MPPNLKRICKLPDRALILVVFGIDGEGEKRAFRFTERDAEPALKVATLLGLRVAWIEDEAARPVPEALRRRYIFASDHGNDGVAPIPEQRGV
jgi:hypothetical protein